MNAPRDPDRQLRAWLDLMPDEVPDRVVSNVLHATEAAPQVRRPFGPAFRRFSPMNRLPYAAAAAVIVAVVAGGALLLRPSSNTGGPPSPSPTQATTATFAPALAPEALRSTWVANAGPAASPGSPGSLARLVINAAGDKVSVFVKDVETFISTPVATQSAEFDLISAGTADGCQIGDLGRYGFAFASDGTLSGSDGTQLALTVIADACAARKTALNRGWVHAIDANSNGGRGISTAFTPMFLITLPPAGYLAERNVDSVGLTSTTPDRYFLAIRNPVGRADPCSSNGGAKLPIAPTIKAATAYLRTLPGFTVQSTALQIDGHPAVLLTVPSVLTADCPSHRVQQWTTNAGDGSGGWFLRQGDTDVIYLVEVNGNLILLQWLGAGVTTAEEQALLATVRFTSTLPQ